MAGNFFLFREIRIMKEVEMIWQTCEMSDRVNLKHGEFFRLLGKCFSSSWQKKITAINIYTKLILRVSSCSFTYLFEIILT